MSDDLQEKTRQLLNDLNYFLAHIIIYFIVNISLVLFAFGNLSSRWWVFLIVLFCSLALLYHCIKVYGVDLLKSRNKKLNLLWSFFFKLTIG
ncbi:2TM domain-containing protein [Fulvivirga sp.]|uniref:2TM domain-containing protein n=1 Tax=Fulvivirga sp. TaxID=1931237 RepID=UPI0032EC7D79